MPKNVAAFKEKCEAEKARVLERLDKEHDESKARMKKATSDADRAKFLKGGKKLIADIKAEKSHPWHMYPVRIDTTTVGSIGEFFTPMENNMRVSVRYRTDKINGDKVSGAIIHDGATPRLLVRAGGALAKDIYTERGPSSETQAMIIGGKGFMEGKTDTLRGLFEVVETKPLTLKPFDVEPYK